MMSLLTFIIIFTFLILTVFLVGTYGLYRFVFCHPSKRRPEMHNIPNNNLYEKCRDIMLEEINIMESTPFESVSIESHDNLRLYGKLYIMKEDAPLLIFFHGYHGIAEWDGYGCFRICKENGINILMVDQRTHGKSEGSAITFGINERYDCRLWTEYAVKRFGRSTDIILAGVSMGAATVIMASELGLPDNVKIILADCGFTEPASIIKETVRNMKLPVEPVYRLINIAARIFGGFDIEETSPLSAVRKLHIPTLFIHGKEDTIIPLYMSEELYENCSAVKERALIEGADHANSAMTDYYTYKKVIVEFLRQNKVI